MTDTEEQNNLPKFLLFFLLPMSPRKFIKMSSIFMIATSSTTCAYFIASAIIKTNARESVLYSVVNIVGVVLEIILLTLCIIYLVLACKNKFPAIKIYGIAAFVLTLLIFIDEIINLLWLILVFSNAVETEGTKAGLTITTGSFAFGLVVFSTALFFIVWQHDLCFQIIKFHQEITDGSLEPKEETKATKSENDKSSTPGDAEKKEIFEAPN